MKHMEYWKSTLGDAERVCYDRVRDGIYRRMPTVECGEASPETIQRVLSYVALDHPEIFYLPYSVAIRARVFASDGKREYAFDWTPLYSAGRLASAESKMRMIAGKLSAEAKSDADDGARVLRAVTYLIDHTAQAYEVGVTSDASSALFAGRADGIGIAKALKFLLDAMDIPNLIVEGMGKASGKSGHHAWNIVTVGENRYHVDAAFMLAANAGRKPPYEKYCFLCDDGAIAASHEWDRRAVPACTDASFGNASGLLQCKSLYEWKQGLTEALSRKDEVYEAILDIRVDSEKELVRLVQSSMQAVMDRMRVCQYAEIRIGGEKRICVTMRYPDPSR